MGSGALSPAPLDGYFDWFWPGTVEDAPEGFDPAAFDCDDLDPTVAGGVGCPTP